MDVLGDVIVPDEQDVQLEVTARCHQPSIVLLELQARMAQQLRALTGQAPVRLQRDTGSVVAPFNVHVETYPPHKNEPPAPGPEAGGSQLVMIRFDLERPSSSPVTGEVHVIVTVMMSPGVHRSIQASVPAVDVNPAGLLVRQRPGARAGRELSTRLRGTIQTAPVTRFG